MGWMLTDHMHDINELTDHTGVQCDSRASRAWDMTGRLDTLLLISRIIEWRLRFSSDLYCWLRKKNLNDVLNSLCCDSCLIFNALLPSIGLASTVLLLATHMWDGWPMLPCQQFCGQRTWLSVLTQHTALFGDCTYHLGLQKLSANIAKWISQSHSVQHEEILDDHQKGCWIWPCIYTTPGNELHICKWHSWDSSVFLWF